MKLSYERDGQEYSTEAETLPPAATAYLLQYGWRQSLQDSIAGLEKATKEDFAARKAAAEEAEVDFNEDLETTVTSAIEGALNKRMDAIVAGTISTVRAGVSRDPLTQMVRRVAEDKARQAVKAAGAKMPKGEAWTKLVAAVMEKYAEACETEAKRRLEEKAATAIDLDDLGIEV